jgi:predicted transcriptional regulator
MNMTKKELAKRVGIDYSYLWYIMANRRKALNKRMEIITLLENYEKDDN